MQDSGFDSKLTSLNLQLPEIKSKNKYNFIGQKITMPRNMSIIHGEESINQLTNRSSESINRSNPNLDIIRGYSNNSLQF